MRIRAARTDVGDRVSDDVDRSDVVIQGEMDFALIQMKGEALAMVDAALARLETGEYGSCVECAADIAAPRLQAMPFAVRCRTCEESRERRTRQSGRPTERTSLDRESLGSQLL